MSGKEAIMDLRVKKTEISIYNAFMELRAEKPLEKISVKELTDKALISKQTFYLHYKDIFDLSEHIEERLINDIMEGVTYPDNFIENIKPVTIEIFNRCLENRQLIRTIFSGSRASVFTNGLEKEIKAAVYEQRPELRADLKTNIYMTFLVQGCYHAYQQYGPINLDRVVKIIGELTDNFAIHYSADDGE